MNILRRISIGLLASVLSISLLGLAGTHLVSATLRRPETVKNWLNDSGFYDNFIESVIENVNEGNNQEGIPISDPRVKKIIGDSFSPEFLRENAEKALDGTYAWLEGKTDKPEFQIDIASAKQRLTDGLTSYAVQRAESLPICTRAQLQTIDTSNIDPFALECRPAGISSAQIGQNFKTSLLSNEDFLSDTTFSGAELTSDNSPRQNSDLDRVSSAYQSSGLLPYIFAVLTVLSSLGVIFLSSQKLKGAQRVGVIFLTSGIIIALSRYVLNSTTNWLDKRVSSASSEIAAGQQLATNLVAEANKDISRFLLWYAVIFVLMGAGLIIAVLLVRKSRRPESTSDTKEKEDIEPARQDPTVVK